MVCGERRPLRSHSIGDMDTRTTRGHWQREEEGMHRGSGNRRSNSTEAQWRGAEAKRVEGVYRGQVQGRGRSKRGRLYRGELLCDHTKDDQVGHCSATVVHTHLSMTRLMVEGASRSMRLTSTSVMPNVTMLFT